MKTVERQKMCPNCDGRISPDTTQCPYCFTTLQAEKVFNNPPVNPPVQENFLYSPPYSAKPAETTSKNPALEKEESKPFWPILLLTMGGNLFTLGVLQFFFSDHGTIHLEINGSYWLLMLLVSLPLFYFGLKSLSKD